MALNIHIKLISENATVPAYAHPNDSGMDVYASEDVLIQPGQTVAVPTGITLAIPDGYEIQVRPRSGLSLNTMLRIPNSPGTIDAGFRDEVKIIMHNASSDCVQYPEGTLHGASSKGNPKGPYRIKRGDRVAQLILAKTERAAFVFVDSLDEIGNDRMGGFGSTGH